MDNNIIRAVFDSTDKTRTEAAYQWDYGQILKVEGLDLPEAYEVHFSNEELTGEAATAIGNADGVSIPDAYFQSGQNIYAWIYLHTGEDDGETEYKILIPILKRAKPTDYEPDPVQQDAITQAIAALNSAVAKTDEDSASAEEAAKSAADSESNAEAWAVGQRGGYDVSPGDPTYQNNSKHYAEVAAQNADASGYAWFDIDDEVGELRVTVANNLDNDLRFAVNENTGILEVVIK